MWVSEGRNTECSAQTSANVERTHLPTQSVFALIDNGMMAVKNVCSGKKMVLSGSVGVPALQVPSWGTGAGLPESRLWPRNAP